MMNALRNGFVLSVVGAVLLGSVLGWVIFGDHGSGSGSTAQSGRTALQISLRRGIYPALGLALEQPTSWLASTQAGVLRLASPDAGQTSMTVGDLAPAGNEVKLRPAINTQLVKTFQPARVIAQRRGPIGKTPAITTAILGTSRNRHKVLILSTALSSKYRTYSIQVFFNAPHPSRQSLLEVRNMLASVSFFAPTTG